MNKIIPILALTVFIAPFVPSSADATGQRGFWKLGIKDAPEFYREAIGAAITELRKMKERPEDFFVQFPEKIPEGPVIILNLWHKSAFEKKNAGMNGNPGGKCRDMYYDKNLDTIVKVLFWQ